MKNKLLIVITSLTLINIFFTVFTITKINVISDDITEVSRDIDWLKKYVKLMSKRI